MHRHPIGPSHYSRFLTPAVHGEYCHGHLQIVVRSTKTDRNGLTSTRVAGDWRAESGSPANPNPGVLSAHPPSRSPFHTKSGPIARSHPLVSRCFRRRTGGETTDASYNVPHQISPARSLSCTVTYPINPKSIERLVIAVPVCARKIQHPCLY